MSICLETQDAKKMRRKIYYEKNKEAILAEQKQRYEKNKIAILDTQKKYKDRKIKEGGEEYRAMMRARRKKLYDKNIDSRRKSKREAAAKKYRDDPWFAAIKRAKTILASQTGLPRSELSPDIVEAKAIQLLVKREAQYPGRSVGEVMSSEDRKMRKAQQWQAWYSANREKRLEYEKSRRMKSKSAA